MTLYKPKDFNAPGTAESLKLMTQNPFATLISSSLDSQAVSHLPLIINDPNEQKLNLLGHLAKANPHSRLLKSATSHTAIFHGPHAYISPAWYKPSPDNVPTWNYAVVHISGKIAIINDRDQAYERLQHLVETFDKEWTLNLADQDRDEMLNQIVIFTMSIDTLDGKFKLSQNRSQDDQKSVRQHLQQSSLEMDRRTGNLMTQPID